MRYMTHEPICFDVDTKTRSSYRSDLVRLRSGAVFGSCGGATADQDSASYPIPTLEMHTRSRIRCSLDTETHVSCTLNKEPCDV